MEYPIISKIITAAILVVAMSLTGALMYFTKQSAIQDSRLQQELNTLEQSQDSKKTELEKRLDSQKQEIEKLKVDVQARAAKKAQLAAVKTVVPVVTTVVKAARSGNCELYRPLVSQYSWNVSVAMAVMQAESGCNPNAANLTDSHATCKGSFGLFQIACFDGQVYDPAQNIAVAWRKYQARNWQPWGAFTNGSYLKYL